jgi:hypothetical protein
MSSLAVSGIIFGCIVGGMVLGVLLRALLPEKHLSAETKDLVKLSMGLIGTMTALVLGLLIASAKGTYDTQRNGLAQLAGNVIVLDRALAHYGPDAKGARDMLKASVDDMIQRTWPNENPQSGSSEGKSGSEGKYEGIYEKIQDLTPENPSQRAFQAQALNIAMDMGKSRWQLFAQKGSSIPTPFLVVMVAWLTLLLTSFSMFAPPNTTVIITLLICALAVSSAIFLVLELDRPFDGILQVSSAPVQAARAQLGR